jgi:hypothetical protein
MSSLGCQMSMGHPVQHLHLCPLLLLPRRQRVGSLLDLSLFLRQLPLRRWTMKMEGYRPRFGVVRYSLVDSLLLPSVLSDLSVRSTREQNGMDKPDHQDPSQYVHLYPITTKQDREQYHPSLPLLIHLYRASHSPVPPHQFQKSVPHSRLIHPRCLDP